MTDKENFGEEETHWNIEEFQAWIAINLMTRQDCKRWILGARRVLGTLNIGPEDLLREATLRILCGQRKLNRIVPIEVNLYGVMRSIASSWHKQRKRRPEISLEELVDSDEEGHDVLEVLLVPDDARAPSPEEELMYKQEMNVILELFSDRPDAQMVIMGRQESLKGVDLARAADLNATQLASVQRLIARRLAEYRREA